MAIISFEQFLHVDMRVGTVVAAEIFHEAKKPALKVWVDFGAIGILKTSAQIQGICEPNALIGKQIIGVVNFPPKQIGHFMSEFLLLCTTDNGTVTSILHPDRPVENGQRIA